MLVAATAALLPLAVGCGGDGSSTPTSTTSSTVAGAPATIVPNGPPEGVPSSIDGVEDGQCLNNVPSPTQRDVAVLLVGCDRPHRYEVYLTFRFPPGHDPAPKGAPYPGETPVRTASEQECYDQFAGWMGGPWSASEFDIQVWFPSADSWTTSADRKVLCAAYLLSGKLTVGSARGTAR
jgi:hypothetical protein